MEGKVICMNKVIVIVGPTAVGKTRMSVLLAKKFDGEIINADSTQVYRGMDIATAKIREDEKENIPHHLFDICDITEEYNVFTYQRDCRAKIKEIQSRGKIPILVGGTGLYIKAALYDYSFNDEGVKSNLYEKVSTKELYNQLLKVDPNTSIHPNNRKRVIRSLEYYTQTGQCFSEKQKTDILLYDVVWIGLTTDRTTLYQKINHRVDLMVEDGLLDEAKKIYQSKIRSKAVMTPIGYKELFPYFEGEETLPFCLELVKKNCRHYAKRQYTWFYNQFHVQWFTVDYNDFSHTEGQVLEYIKTQI